jgi:hypothetical protein
LTVDLIIISIVIDILFPIRQAKIIRDSEYGICAIERTVQDHEDEEPHVKPAKKCRFILNLTVGLERY